MSSRDVSTASRGAVDWRRLHHVAMAELDVRIRLIPPDHWSASTPCEEWDVYDLVQHNIVENLWVAPLLAGSTVADLAEAFDEDVLGSDPVDVWEESRLAALDAFDHADLDETVDLSFGTTPRLVYLQQRVSDLLVHAWDLAVAIGVDDRLDEEAVTAVLAWAVPQQELFASVPQYFDPPLPSDPSDPAQTRLLHLLGRAVG